MNSSEELPGFESWLIAQGPALLQFAYLMTGDQERAADAVQDALVSAYPRWQQIVQRGDPGAYLRRAVVNADTSRWRRFRRRERVTPDPTLLAASRVCADHADGHALEDAVWRLCLALPARQRAAVVLRYYDDRPDAEIAAILGCSVSTVRSQIHRGLAALRDQMAKDKEVTTP